MITLTPIAAQQILKSFDSKNEQMVLRIAVQQKPNSEFHYIMGMDESKTSDTRYLSHDVKIAISSDHADLLNKLEIDYVEMSSGKFDFIFKNPNDPKFKQPTE